MRTARSALLLSTWCTWLAAFLIASGVAALNVARLFAEWALFAIMARSSARMFAVREVPTALLLAGAMFLFDNLGTLTRTAPAAFICASMTARQPGATGRLTSEVCCVDVDVALHRDFVLTSRDYAFDRLTALDLSWVLILPAGQLLYTMSTRQLDIDV